jgi:hypothetical protein
MGAPPLFGGYEYTPLLIHRKDRDYSMAKHNESLLMLPRLFSENGYKVTVTDPPFANYSMRPDVSIFKPYPSIKAEDLLGNYTAQYLKAHPELQALKVSLMLKTYLIRFSILRMAPPLFRVFLYDKSRWLCSSNVSGISVDLLNNYVSLSLMPQLTAVSNDKFNTYTAIDNDLTHCTGFLQAPDYTLATKVTNFGTGPFAHFTSYHVNIAALVLMGKWLQYLKEQGVYDNTRIIISADHGYSDNIPGNITLPDGESLQFCHPFFFVKDFNSHGPCKTDMTFMTNGDAPTIAVTGLIKNARNPFTGKLIREDKADGATITTMGGLSYTIEPDQWLHVHDNIFKAENWTRLVLK